MFCSLCGKEISEDSKFCYSCGSRNNFVQNTDVPLLPSDKTAPVIIQNVKGEITDDKKYDEPISISNTEKTLEDDKIYDKYLKDKENKKRRKWGWGWLIIVLMYTSYYGKLKRDDNLHTMIIEFLGFFIMLILYFWLRNYFRRYYDDYKPSLISGIISIFFIAFLVEFLYVLFIRF